MRKVTIEIELEDHAHRLNGEIKLRAMVNNQLIEENEIKYRDYGDKRNTVNAQVSIQAFLSTHVFDIAPEQLERG